MKQTIQDLKMEVETIKKTQRGTTLEIKILEKKSGTTDVCISNTIRDGRENLRCRRFHREHGHNNQRKCKKILAQNIHEVQDTMRRPNLQIIGIVRIKIFNLKGQQISSTKL